MNWSKHDLLVLLLVVSIAISVDAVLTQVVVPFEEHGAQSNPSQGSMSVDTASVNSIGILLFLRNTGTKTEVLGTVYVDNILISNGITFNGSAAPQALDPNAVIPVWIPGTGWADGTLHTIKIIANDGTPVSVIVH
jgi:hypothetical protein